MTTNERGGDELKPMTKEERAALEIFQNLAHEDRKYDGGYVLDISLGVPAIAEALESTRRAAIAEAMNIIVAARAVLVYAPLFGDGTTEITSRHVSGGSATMGPNETENFCRAFKALKASLSENQTKGKGE